MVYMDGTSEIIRRSLFIYHKTCFQSLGMSKAGRPKSLFIAHKCLILPWLPSYRSYRKGQVFREYLLHGYMAQFDHPHTSTAHSHPSDGSLPSLATGSYASGTFHSEFS